MRRLLVILAAFGMMWAVRSLRMDGMLAGPDPLTLAAVGFVVLASFTIGELGGALKLPKITGYIVSGVLLGPQVGDILSKQVVGEMQTFNTLALGLIATTAGLELDLSAIRKVLRTLVVTVAAKIPLLVVIVGGAFYVAESTFGILGLGDSGSIIALALVFAVLGIGTSPAIALAIVNETRAKGRLSDLVLAIAVVKDLVVVVCLAIAIAVARVLIAPDAPFGADVLVHVAEELGASIAVGALVGFVLIAYMRFVHAEMLLAVLVAILLTAEVSAVLHLELLLVFIAAGFVVRNFSSYEHSLLHSLERIALPVFVVFFTTAGANVDLEGTLTLLPLALVIAGARGAAFFLSSKLGAKVGKEAAPVANNAWFAYLPQAGVTLGLVFLAAEKLPELAGPLGQTGMAMVALHLLVGPVLLGMALRRAGEIPSEAVAGAAGEAEAAHDEPEAEAPPRVAPPAQAPEEHRSPPGADELAAQVGLPELVGPVERVRAILERTRLDFLEEVARPRAAEARAYAAGIFEAPDEGESAVLAIHRRLPKDRPDLVADWVPAVSRLEQTVRAETHRLPNVVAVPLSPSLLEPQPDDGLGRRLRKRGRAALGRLGLRRGKVRDVPVRLLGRLACEARLAEAAVSLAGAWPRSYAAMLEQVAAVVTEDAAQADALEAVERIADAFVDYADRTLQAMAAELLEELVGTMIEAGGPTLPVSALRFSKVEPVARAARQRVEREAQAWLRIADAAFDTVRARTAVLAFGQTLQGVLGQRVRGPLETAREQLLPTVGQVLQRLGAAAEHLREEAPTPARIERAIALAKSAYPKADRTRVRRARARFRRAAQGHLLVSELTRVIEGVPAELTVLPPGTVLDPDDRVESVTTVPLDFGRRAEMVFLERLAPRLDEVLEPVSDLVAGSDLRLDETVQVAVYGIEAAREAHAELDEEQVKLFEVALERAIAEGEGYQAAFEGALGDADAAVEAEGARATEELGAMLGADPGAGRRVRSQVRATRRAIRARIAAWGRQLATALGAAARRFGRGAHLSVAQPGLELDASAMRAAVEAETRRAPGLQLPPLYDKLFSPNPVDDLRLAVAHKDVLEPVSRRLGARNGDAARVLVIGEHGSGRTSLLNALELRHQRHRVVRLDAFFHLRAEGVVSALAAELSCRDSERGVVDALLERPTLVLIDDLERHLSADESGALELERLTTIIVRSRTRTAWAATTTPHGMRALEVLAPFGEAFDQHVRLPALSADALRAVVEARSRLGGVGVALPGLGPLGRLRRGGGSPEQVFYARLREACGGNLRAGLQVYLRSLRSGPEQGLSAVRPEPARLPPLAGLSVQSLAVLGLMLRFGPHDVHELSRALRLPTDAVRMCTLHLLDAGLLYRPGGSAQELLYVPPEIERALSQALARAGLLARGTP